MVILKGYAKIGIDDVSPLNAKQHILNLLEKISHSLSLSSQFDRLRHASYTTGETSNLK